MSNQAGRTPLDVYDVMHSANGPRGHNAALIHHQYYNQLLDQTEDVVASHTHYRQIYDVARRTHDAAKWAGLIDGTSTENPFVEFAETYRGKVTPVLLRHYTGGHELPTGYVWKVGDVHVPLDQSLQPIVEGLARGPWANLGQGAPSCNTTGLFVQMPTEAIDGELIYHDESPRVEGRDNSLHPPDKQPVCDSWHHDCSEVIEIYKTAHWPGPDGRPVRGDFELQVGVCYLMPGCGKSQKELGKHYIRDLDMTACRQSAIEATQGSTGRSGGFPFLYVMLDGPFFNNAGLSTNYLRQRSQFVSDVFKGMFVEAWTKACPWDPDAYTGLQRGLMQFRIAEGIQPHLRSLDLRDWQRVVHNGQRLFITRLHMVKDDNSCVLTPQQHRLLVLLGEDATSLEQDWLHYLRGSD